ncbi:MAG: acetoin dehydrogenase dihydrolipoyllysine-residue acetyltransferase subunit [Aestuariivirgaceae bacterium]
MAKGIYPVAMPKWGMTMTEGTVAGWLAEEGDEISEGHEFLEIETTKITNVVEAQATGTLRRRLIAAGSTVPVGSLLAVIAEDRISDAELDEFIITYAPVESNAAGGSGTGPVSRMVDAGGRNINVATLGDAGDDVILLHGFGGDLNSWMFNQPELAAQFKVHAVDLPGHGQSTLDVGSGSVPGLAAAILGLMDAEGVPSAHLVGHSLGGAVALFMAIKHPEQVHSATLICPGGLGPDINLDFIDDFIAADRRKDMKSVPGLLFADPDAVQRKMVEDSLKFKRLDGVPAALQTIRRANFTDTHQAGGMREGLASSKVPVQVIWGADDKIIPATHMSGLPQSVETHLLDGAGHMPHMEQAAAVTRLIANFAAQSGGR